MVNGIWGEIYSQIASIRNEVRSISGGFSLDGFNGHINIGPYNSIRIFPRNPTYEDPNQIGCHVKIYPVVEKRPLYPKRYRGEISPHTRVTDEDLRVVSRVLSWLVE